jgi:hypothetical protein
MTDPRHVPAAPGNSAEPTVTTGIARGMNQLEDLENRLPQPTEAELAYAKEPLFSKKVLVAWAAAALAVWMAFNIVVPVIKETIRAAVVEGIEEPGSNTATKRVIVTPNGTRITISRDVVGAPQGPPVVVGTPEKPTAPEAVPALPAEPVSGKK